MVITIIMQILIITIIIIATTITIIIINLNNGERANQIKIWI